MENKILPAMVLMDAADLLETPELSELKEMTMPVGDVAQFSGLAYHAAQSAWSAQTKQGRQVWRTLEMVAATAHRGLPADHPDFRDALLRHITTLTAMVMDIDRQAAAGK